MLKISGRRGVRRYVTVSRLSQAISDIPVVQVLKQRPNFRVFLLGQVVSQLGSALHRIALMWLVLELTGSALKMGSVMIVYVLPELALGMIAGTLVDRMDRRKVMIAADLFRGSIVLALPVLAALQLLSFYTILVLSFLLALASTFYQPAKTAALPRVVAKEELLQANSLTQTAWQVTNVVGPALGGLLIGIVGSVNVFLFDALSYAVSALALSRIVLELEGRSGESAIEAGGSGGLEGARAQSVTSGGEDSPAGTRSVKKLFGEIMADLKEGLIYVYNQKAILYVIGIAVVLNFVGAPVGILTPIFAEKVLGVGATGFGLINSAGSVGMLLGALLVGYLSGVRSSVLMMSSIMVGGVFMGLFGLTQALWQAMIVFALFGVSNSFTNVTFFTSLQQMVPDDKMGRVSSVVMTGVMIAQPLAMAVTGFLADSVALHWLYAAAGIVMVVMGGAALGISELAAFDEPGQSAEKGLTPQVTEMQ